MRIDILTLFPDIFTTPLKYSIIKRAMDMSAIEVNIHNIRDYSTDKARTTDDYPFGGGPGMIMKVEPIFNGLQAIRKQESEIILLSPQGERFDQKLAMEISLKKHIILICGRYKGVDERVRNHLIDREISIGDFVTSGGEIPALVIIDAISRLLPKVLGNFNSAESDSFMSETLDAPYYTRPQEFQGMTVPQILLSGNHKKIEEWRTRESLKKTMSRRPDLLGSKKR
ncbi:MAG: tRNA (guanosine(37)-N1)-methyltransferase TrmD [Candidatus Cloacimonadota bacterium]|nr:MAG: tRNA (guanosine(37)-N1)-methyltransferase TrmD [Candidatus Cloacimonadota bacterium]